MTSTLDVFELSSPSRPRDQRVLDALYPASSEAMARFYEQREDGE